MFVVAVMNFIVMVAMVIYSINGTILMGLSLVMVLNVLSAYRVNIDIHKSLLQLSEER